MLSDHQQGLTTGEKLLCQLSKTFNLQQTNKIDREAQDALALYAEKILDKRKKERERKQKEQLKKQYQHKGGKIPKNLFKQEDKMEEQKLNNEIGREIIEEELSEDCSSSQGGNYSYIYE